MSRLLHITDWPSRAGPTLGPGGRCPCNHLVSLSCGGRFREQESAAVQDDGSNGSTNDIKLKSGYFGNLMQRDDDVVEGKSTIRLRNTNRDLQSIVDDSTQNPIEALFAPAME
ncbi:hypothetical protein DER46DRAFT_580300 [Fusarium sp. MPI-SDFR-AT-0072]|nr:hypothetical protein DER46DRAFT_580300 [Fusarium sp. MPI-SDFR-AT-0072]